MRSYTQDRKEKRARYMREFYAKRKQRLRDLKAELKCTRCGFGHPAALEFHHRDPTQKNFQISRKAWSSKWENVLAEVALCDVLCSNCHRIEHDGEGRPRKY
jgi:hypothetical protein